MIDFGCEHDDQSVLDEIFERAVAEMEEGRDPSLDSLLAGREHLRQRATELYRLAEQVTCGRASRFPRIEGYEILAELGRGGMGAVYLAQQQALGGRPVALKVLPPSMGLSARLRERFSEEARSIARIRHPNVISVYDVVQNRDLQAYAMEWIDGRTLGDLIEFARQHEHEPSPAEIAAFLGTPGSMLPAVSYPMYICQIGIAIARALSELHRAGLIHRDIKPSNILLRSDGTPVLSDFGLARAVGSAVLTQSGQFVGTPAYASPEQLRARSDDLDARVDIYALGVTLYHALTLRIPFQGGSTIQILQQIESGSIVPPRKANPALSNDLQTIILKSMEPDVSRRYQNADALADDIERLVSLRPIHARPAGLISRSIKLVRRNRRTLMSATVGSMAALMLTAVLILYVFFVPRWAQESVRAGRSTLLNPGWHVAVFNSHFFTPSATNRSEAPIKLDDDVISEVIRLYNRALLLQPGNDAVRLERDTIRIAQAIGRKSQSPLPLTSMMRRQAPLTCLCAEMIAESQRALLVDDAPELQGAKASDLRCLGLLAALCASPDLAMEAWSRLDLMETPDPFVEGILGQLYLVTGEAARAYPRLRSASEMFPDLGFLAQALAEAAMLCGDVYKADQVLENIDRMEQLDTQGGHHRVRAQVYAAMGEKELAERKFRSLIEHGGNPLVVVKYAEFLEGEDRLRDAITVLVDDMHFVHTTVGVPRELIRMFGRWWQSLDRDGRIAELERALREDVDDPECLSRALRMLQRSRSTLIGSGAEQADFGRGGDPSEVTDLADWTVWDLVDRLEPVQLYRWGQFEQYPEVFRGRMLEAWLSEAPQENAKREEQEYLQWRASQPAPTPERPDVLFERVRLTPPGDDAWHEFGWNVDVHGRALLATTRDSELKANLPVFIWSDAMAGGEPELIVHLTPRSNQARTRPYWLNSEKMVQVEYDESRESAQVALVTNHIDWHARLALEQVHAIALEAPEMGFQSTSLSVSEDLCLVRLWGHTNARGNEVELIDKMYRFDPESGGFMEEATLRRTSGLVHPGIAIVSNDHVALVYSEPANGADTRWIEWFDRRGGTTDAGATWKSLATIHAPGHDEKARLWFAHAIALTRNVLLVSDLRTHELEGGPATSMIWEYSWGNQTRDASTDLDIFDRSSWRRGQFGAAISASEDAVVVGFGTDNERRHPAIVYRRAATDWVWRRRGELWSSDGAPHDSFGQQIVLGDDIAAVGAPHHDSAGLNAGAVFIFDLRDLP